MSEPYSRIVVDPSGNIVMVGHMDFPSQMESPAFTVPGCANADMSRGEYDNAAAGFLPPDVFPGDGSLSAVRGDTSSSMTSADGAVATDGAVTPEPNPILVARKNMLALAQSKLNILTQTDFIAAIQSHIDAVDAAIANEIQATIDAENAPSPPPPPLVP